MYEERINIAAAWAVDREFVYLEAGRDGRDGRAGGRTDGTGGPGRTGTGGRAGGTGSISGWLAKVLSKLLFLIDFERLFG